MAKDPVCGMTVDEKKAVSLTHEGTTYYFCCPACKAQFEKNPKKFAGKATPHDGHEHHQ